jgi:hypothetical protein
MFSCISNCQFLLVESANVLSIPLIQYKLRINSTALIFHVVSSICLVIGVMEDRRSVGRIGYASFNGSL